MPIIYNHQPDDIATPAPPLNVDDGSAGWWSGTQRCFASVALATVIAATSLSTAVAERIHQQTEEIVPASASLAVVDDAWQNPLPSASVLVWSLPYWFDANEIVPSAAASLATDEDFWINPVAPGQSALFWPQPFAFDVQDVAANPSSQVDEDYWIPVCAVQTAVYQWLPIAPDQPDFVSAPQVFHPDEDYGQSLSAVASFATNPFASTPLLPFSSDSDVVFTPPGSGLDEDYWPLFAATMQRPTMYFQAINVWLWTENSQERIMFFEPATPVGVQWLRCHGHARGLFSRRR